jgi:2-polyprenyl-6-methoxyphenol hydroxylase-like FAD-dependent oxidoreductase
MDLLLRSFPKDHLHLGKTCTSIEEQAEKVSAGFSSGESAHADVLIGADGLRSIVRSQIGYDNPIRYSGYTAWRSIARLASPVLEASETWGCGRRFGIHPMTNGRVYWYATANAPEGERDPDGSSQDKLLSLFKGWMHPIEALIRASDAKILRNDIYDRDPLTKWSRGRVTLLGDAAHPMAPDLGQGACQAIEDALELAKSLDSEAGVPESLRRYEASRIPRTTSIVLASRRMGRMGQIESPLLCRLRDLAFQLTPGEVSLRTLAPVVGYEKHLGN